MKRKKKRRRLRRWARGALLLFTCFLLYHGGIFLGGALKEAFFSETDKNAETMDSSAFWNGSDWGTERYPDYVGNENQIIYYNQEDPRWGEKTYGPVDKISDAGCGPTVLAMAVSSFTENRINPKEMCDWAYVNGYCSVGSGSYHTLIAQGLQHFGIETTVTNSREAVKTALQNGKVVIALMGEGHFTSSGHFILLCELDENNMVTVADPKSAERTQKEWDFEIVAEEAKLSPAAGGAFWILDV